MTDKVICTRHAGFLNAETKEKYGKAWRRCARELFEDGYVQITLHPDLFKKGNHYARIHNINDWRETSAESQAREGTGGTIYKGVRYHTDEAHISRWVI